MTHKPYHCRHLFTDGHQCGSPALRGEPLCFYHHAARRPAQLRILAGDTRLAFPESTDLHAVQQGLAELLRLTATVDDRQSRNLLRILANAGANLARIERQTARALQADPARTPVQDYVLDPQRGTLAPAPLICDPSGQNAQPAEPEPRPEGPLPDPVVRLSLQPSIEIVRDPLLEAFKQEQAQAFFREHERQAAAGQAAREAEQAALTPAQREAHRQTRRNRFPPAYRQAFDQLEAEQQAAPTQPEVQAEVKAEVQPEVQTHPQPNQDFGLLQKPPQPTHKPHEAHTELACA